MDSNYAYHLLGILTAIERFQMYLQVTDLIAIVIALGVSVTLVITSALHNARLQRSVREYRKAWLDSKVSK
jgi:hypothetical protein